SGIGRSVARHLVDEGMDVLAVDLEPDPHGPGVPHKADLTDPSANEGCVSAALEQFGRLDVVVPNAGVQYVAPIEEFPLERWQTPDRAFGGGAPGRVLARARRRGIHRCAGDDGPGLDGALIPGRSPERSRRIRSAFARRPAARASARVAPRYP